MTAFGSLGGTSFSLGGSGGASLGLFGPRFFLSCFGFSSFLAPRISPIASICLVMLSRWLYRSCSLVSASMLLSYDERWMAYSVVRVGEQGSEWSGCLGCGGQRRRGFETLAL